MLEDQTILKLPKITIRAGQKTPWPKDFRNNLYMLQNYSQMNYSPSLVRNIKIHDKYHSYRIESLNVKRQSHYFRNII